MHVRIGDIVRFITEKLEGKVTGIIDNNTVNVYCDDYGFEIPASVNDLVVIHSELKSSVTGMTGGNQSISIQSTDALYLAIVPEDFSHLNESRYELHLVNDTAQTCLYSIAFYNGEKYTGIAAGNCSPDSSCVLDSYPLKEIDSHIKAVHIQAIFYQKGICIPKAAIDTEIKIHAANLCKAGIYKQTKWFRSVSQLRILSSDIHYMPEEDTLSTQSDDIKKKEEQPVKPPSKPLSNIVEIDLHIDQLLKTTAGMENKDILEYQLDIFRKALEEYKLRKGKKIIFIHGKGDGILRQRILWELQTKYKRFHHQDASFKQYGYGATMVTIK